MAEQPRGYLSIAVLEASGCNKEENYVWDSTSFEGFVKVELRGGSRNVKVSTKKAPVRGTTIQWNEDVTLEVLEGASELRIMLCREKVLQSSSGQKKGTSVIAACGIYVNDIIEAVPIDKYFELFKPSAGGEGGFVRLSLDYSKDASQLPGAKGIANGTSPAHGSGSKKKRRGLLLLPLVLLAAGAGYLAYKKREEDKGGKGRSASGGRG